jgi:hypothetical protein
LTSGPHVSWAADVATPDALPPDPLPSVSPAVGGVTSSCKAKQQQQQQQGRRDQASALPGFGATSAAGKALNPGRSHGLSLRQGRSRSRNDATRGSLDTMEAAPKQQQQQQCAPAQSAAAGGVTGVAGLRLSRSGPRICSIEDEEAGCAAAGAAAAVATAASSALSRGLTRDRTSHLKQQQQQQVVAAGGGAMCAAAGGGRGESGRTPAGTVAAVAALRAAAAGFGDRGWQQQVRRLEPNLT